VLGADTAALDSQVRGCQGKAPAVDEFADAGGEVIACLGQDTAEDEHVGVEEVDRGSNGFADGSAGLAEQLDGFGAALLSEVDDVTGRLRGNALAARVPGQRPAARDRLQAAEVAAPAERLAGPRQVDMPDVPGGAGSISTQTCSRPWSRRRRSSGT
jgi:hypothetical protein